MKQMLLQVLVCLKKKIPTNFQELSGLQGNYLIFQKFYRALKDILKIPGVFLGNPGVFLRKSRSFFLGNLKVFFRKSRSSEHHVSQMKFFGNCRCLKDLNYWAHGSDNSLPSKYPFVILISCTCSLYWSACLRSSSTFNMASFTFLSSFLLAL